MKTVTNLPEKRDAVEGKPIEDRPLIEVGQWYWTEDGKPGKRDWFGCVTHIGSNYIELTGPDETSCRIHLNEFEKKVTLESDPESVIRGRMALHQDVVKDRLGQIREITARLGLDPRESTKAPTSESRELSTFNAMPDLKKYKKALIQAKDKQLPKLFKEVEEAHEEVAKWMLARTIPMKAMSSGLEGLIEKIKDRVFNVSLYAGLTEEVTQILDGPAAPAEEKLHLFQRMAYMDEECLVNYRHGGMEFRDIGEFDEWISKAENLNRLLPEARSMVAFRVRRDKKYREWDGDLSAAFVIFRLEQLDKLTFMYIRNGAKLYRMNCDLEFGEHIFPSAHQIDLTEPMMAKQNCSDFSDIITKRDYDVRLQEYQEAVRLSEKWEKENPKKDWFENPHRHEADSFRDPAREYVPFNKSSVYYDDIEEEVENQVKYYNRIALILQGIFDRSEILHPHPPARLWEPGGMAQLVELVYDGAGALHFGEPPDFEAYRAACNASLGAGSVTIGQEEAWEIKCAKIENSRWNSRATRSVKRFHPYGDPGPGYISEIKEWSKKKAAAVYRWTRERRSYGSYWDFRDKDKPIPCMVEVTADKLFNVSAYKPGDFKRFYLDPRTRAKYLQWAPLLIEAEEWHAGNLKKDGRLKEKKKRRRKK